MKWREMFVVFKIKLLQKIIKIWWLENKNSVLPKKWRNLNEYKKETF